MIQELQQMGRMFQYGCALVVTLFRWGVVIGGALYVLFNYGLGGLFSAAIIAGVVLLSLGLDSSDNEAPKKRPLPNVFNEPGKFGPDDDDVCYNPAFHSFPGNCYHKNFHGKD